MEKLLELLNEYENEKNSDLYYKFELKNGELYCYDDVTDILWTMQDEAMVICSKKFGFIKWLVKKDKILETEVRPIQIYDYEGKYCDDEFGYSWFNQGLYYRVIMNLSISDTPIEDLISYLK